MDDVRLMVDPNTSRCRGFGFVDFADQDSFLKALSLSGLQDPEGVHLDPSSNGKIKVEAAKPAKENARERHEELARARDETEDMERALRLREARVRELERELRTNRERQNLLDAKRAVEHKLAEERARQEEIRRAEEMLRLAEEALAVALKGEKDRTRALEAIAHAVDDEQTLQHHDDKENMCDGASGGTLTSQAEEDVKPELRVKNTFFEFYLPKDTEPLVRTRTAPSVYGTGAATALKKDSGYGSSQSSTAQATPASSSLLTFQPAPSPPAPWALKRDTSNILRSILEDKMEAESGVSRGRNGEVVGTALRGRSHSETNRMKRSSDDCKDGKRHDDQDTVDSKTIGGLQGNDHFSWADVSEDLAPVDVMPWSSSSRSRCVVRIRNLPLVPDKDIQDQLLDEFARLWRVVRARPPPEIERIQIKAHDNEDVATYAARATGTEARVTFAQSEDAHWLVDGRLPANWTSAETLSLRGRVLHAEWPPLPPPADWRRLRYKADTDASSQISYETVGTKRSFSSAVERRRTADSPGAAKASTENPAQNRTVILVGISPTLPAHTVRSEVYALIRRLWQRDGYRFDPETQLHRGTDGGLSVRSSRRPGDENDGSCVLRLRNYADAKWLVEQAKGLSIEGRPLRAMWARPRTQGGNSFGVLK